MIREERLCAGVKEDRLTHYSRSSRRSAGPRRDANVGRVFTATNCIIKFRADAGSEQYKILRLCDGGVERSGKFSDGILWGHKNNARFRAELTTTQRERFEELAGYLRTAGACRSRQNENGIATSQFTIKGNWGWPGAGKIEQYSAAFQRAGESYSANSRMFHKIGADGETRIKQKGKGSFRQFAGVNGSRDSVAGQFTGARMRRVRFHYYRIASGQGRCGVSSRYGKRERKIAGAENGNGSERFQQGPDCRLWRWFTCRIAAIDSRGYPRSFFDHGGEESQLAAGSPQFALQASDRQRCFFLSPRDDFAGGRFHLNGDSAKKRGTVRAR